MRQLLEPKIVRTRETFIVETGVDLRERFCGYTEKAISQRRFWHDVLNGLRDTDGCISPSMNQSGVVRYTVERSRAAADPAVVHDAVRGVILSALAKLKP